MKKINFFLIVIMSIINTFAVFQIGSVHPDRMGPIIIFYLCLWLPFLLKKIHPSILFVYLVFIILSQYIGSILNMYKYLWWYDLFTHSLSGFLCGYLAIYLLYHFRHMKKNDLTFQIIFVICFVLSIALIWEFLEFGADFFLKMNTQHSIETGVQDTMEDLLVASLGGVLFIGCYSFEVIKSKIGITRFLIKHMD